MPACNLAHVCACARVRVRMRARRLVPFGFFISLSINESTLPDVQAASASEVYSEGSRSRQKSGIVSAFSFMQQKRDDMMPSFAKKV
eukprot:939724-Pleurochrysis_carterae.AAC.1